MRNGSVGQLGAAAARGSASNADVRGIVDDTLARLRVNQRRLALELRRSLAAELDGVTAEAFRSLATAYRTVLSGLDRLRALESTPDPSRDHAVAAFSLLAAALAAQDRSLRAASDGDRKRYHKVMRARLSASAEAFRVLDELLGCPYGCRRP